MYDFEVNDVVQFNEKHKWCGSLGIVDSIKICGDGEDVRYMVGVPVPQQGTAYIFTMKSADAIEYIGKAIFIPSDAEEPVNMQE